MTAGKPQTCKVCDHPKVQEINAKIQKIKDNLCICPYCGAEWGNLLSRNAHMGQCDQKNNGIQPLTWGRLEDEYGISRSTFMTHGDHIAQSPKLQTPTNGVLRKIQELSDERQALWRKSGRRAATRRGNVGFTQKEQERLHEIDSRLKKLWHQHTGCTNPFCACCNGDGERR